MALALVSDNDRVIGRFDEAVRIADRLSIADPENSFSYWFLAEALDGDGRHSGEREIVTTRDV